MPSLDPTGEVAIEATEHGAVEIILVPLLAPAAGGLARVLRRVLQKTMRVQRGDGVTHEIDTPP